MHYILGHGSQLNNRSIWLFHVCFISLTKVCNGFKAKKYFVHINDKYKHLNRCDNLATQLWCVIQVGPTTYTINHLMLNAQLSAYRSTI